MTKYITITEKTENGKSSINVKSDYLTPIETLGLLQQASFIVSQNSFKKEIKIISHHNGAPESDEQQ